MSIRHIYESNTLHLPAVRGYLLIDRSDWVLARIRPIGRVMHVHTLEHPCMTSRLKRAHVNTCMAWAVLRKVVQLAVLDASSRGMGVTTRPRHADQSSHAMPCHAGTTSTDSARDGSGGRPVATLLENILVSCRFVQRIILVLVKRACVKDIYVRRVTSLSLSYLYFLSLLLLNLGVFLFPSVVSAMYPSTSYLSMPRYVASYNLDTWTRM